MFAFWEEDMINENIARHMEWELVMLGYSIAYQLVMFIIFFGIPGYGVAYVYCSAYGFTDT